MHEKASPAAASPQYGNFNIRYISTMRPGGDGLCRAVSHCLCQNLKDSHGILSGPSDLQAGPSLEAKVALREAQHSGVQLYHLRTGLPLACAMLRGRLVHHLQSAYISFGEILSDIKGLAVVTTWVCFMHHLFEIS